MKENKQIQRKNEKGITLLALIVVIIVLLILAGVSIAVLTGENGIINNAIAAKRATDKAVIDEELKLAIMASFGTNGKISLSKLITEVEKADGTVTGDTFPVIVSKGNVSMQVAENGYKGLAPIIEYSLAKTDGTKINESEVLKEEEIKLKAKVTNMSDLSSVTAITVLDPSGNEIEDGITVDLANGTVEANVAQDGAYTVNVTALNDKGTSVTQNQNVTVSKKTIRPENIEKGWVLADETNAGNDWYAYTDVNAGGSVVAVNAPKLASGMSAIKYVGESSTSSETLATLTSGSKWANAMTKDGSMWVWIPRYAYRITNGYRKSGANLNSSDATKGAGTIEIAFVKYENGTNVFLDSSLNGQTIVTSGVTNSTYTTENTWILAPGFEFGDDHLDGFWFAKFEASNTDGYGASSSTANNTALTLQIKPNVTSWRSITSENIFTVCRNLENSTTYFNSSTNVDTHMTKNVEWGAVAYLAHSKYGLNGQEVYINNYNGYKTGISGTSATASSSSDDSNKYNTTVGINASTTKNIYGIYDMSGGAYEYVAGCYTGKTAKLTSNTNATFISKYIDVYSSYAISKYGDAVYETSKGTGAPFTDSWFADYSNFVGAWGPVFGRGGLCSGGSDAGLFCFSECGGHASGTIGFRPACVVK